MICRPLLLHNEFMPAITGERNWDYRVLGYHDGMTVKNSIILEDTNSFAEIFRTCVAYEEEAIHPFFTQFLFGFHPDEKTDRRFWDNSQHWNFTYISLLQFANPDIGLFREILESSSFIQDELKSLKCPDETVRTIAYYSLDNSDLIFVIKCDNCKLGAKIINNLHCSQNQDHNFHLRNSYTVLALNSQDINHSEKLSQLDEKIDLLELRIVERSSNSGAKLHRKLYDILHLWDKDIKIERKALLGTENEAIIIRDIAWKYLIPFYRTCHPEGILCNSNADAQNYANAISTKIMLSLELEDSSIAESNTENETVNSHRSKLLCEIIYNNIKELYQTKIGGRYQAELKNLLMFTDALWRFESAYHNGKAFSDYNFFSILRPLYIFVELSRQNEDVFSNYYYDFMNGMKLCTQNFTKPDRVYSLITDFNMRYFDVPSKLVTLYSAYIYYLKNALNSHPKFQYEFLVCPGVNNKTQVKELMPRESPTQRLFFVEIPEQQVYYPKRMLIILGHETAHFVGRNLRLRKERLQALINACCHAVANSLKHFIAYKENWNATQIVQKDWELLEQNLAKWSLQCIFQSCDREFLKHKYYTDSINADMIDNNLLHNLKYFYHTDNLKENLIRSLEDLLSSSYIDVLGFAIQTGINLDSPDRESWDRCYEQHCRIVCEAVWDFASSRGKYTALTLENVVNDIVYLLKECYADLISILALKLSMEDYLNSFIETFETDHYDKSYITQTILLPRIAIVMSVMNYSFSDNDQGSPSNEGFRWSDNEPSHLKNPGAIRIEIETQRFLANLISDPYYYTDPAKFETLLSSHVNIVYDLYIIQTIMQYLLCCRQKYNAIMNTPDKRTKLESVQHIYQTVQTENMNDFFPYLIPILNKYEEDVYRDIEYLIHKETTLPKGNNCDGQTI